MIALSDIEQLIATVLMSAYIKGERPLSLVLCSRVEAGKSRIVMRFASNPGIELIGDMTAWGIAKHLGRKIQDGKIRHLICPEFSIATSHKHETVAALDAFLCGLIEEGVGKIISAPYKQVEVTAPYGCGVILCISKQDLEKKRTHWFQVGLMSRLIPVSYSYSAATVTKIMHYIKAREYRDEQGIKLEFPVVPQEVDLPSYIANKIEATLVPIVLKVNDPKGELLESDKLYGFRWQRHLQRLAMANTLLAGRDIVTIEDYEQLAHLTEYMNVNGTRVI